jgi:hypothetical protein
LLVFGDDTAAVAPSHTLGDGLHTEVVPPDADNDAALAQAHVPRPSFYVLRPDGHVGLCGPRVDSDALARYFSTALRWRV